MYAFVAYNDLTGEFLAARDALGVKPLYAMQVGAAFLFCSEIRPLLKAHPNALVHALPPGCFLTRKVLQPFKFIGWERERASLAHDVGRLDGLLDEAVRRRLPPQLPAAVFFSGGIDSTLVLHYARQDRPDTPGYFLGGPGAPDYEFAARYAEATGLDFRPIPLPDPLASPFVKLQEVVRTLETFEPEAIKNAFCTSALSARARQDGFRVVLSGEGADELFAGYPVLEESFTDDEAMGVFVRNQHLLQMHTGVLQRLDRCGMRHQVEIREPFLDPGIVDYALGLRGCELVRPVMGLAQGKQPLRDLYDRYPDLLPHQIRDRQKVPLSVGAGLEAERARSPWEDLAEEHISDADFQDGRRRFEGFDLRSKEELLYMDCLARDLDVHRVPHLTKRARIRFKIENPQRLQHLLISDAAPS
jgi:asparagine synthase (glutamine-hydrolysing)